MRKQLAAGSIALLMVLAVPAFAAPSNDAAQPAGTAVSAELPVDGFVLAGEVSTELVSAVRCPIQTLGCNQENDDCGITSGVCHCKAGGGQLKCVKNPDGPIE